MKILHVFDGYGTPGERALPGQGSIPTVVYYLAKHAVAKGHDVTICERDLGTLKSEEMIDQINYLRIRSLPLPEAPYGLLRNMKGIFRLIKDCCVMATKLNKVIEQNDFDVIHIHFPFAASVLISLHPRLCRKIIYTAHIGEEKKRLNLDPSGPMSMLGLFSPDLYLMKRVKKSIVLNDKLRTELIAKGLSLASLVTIPNGVESREYCVDGDEGVRKKYGLEGKVAVMFAGTITPRKGIDYLIQSASLLRSREDIVFIIVGNPNVDADYSSKVRTLIEQGSLTNVRLVGFVPHSDLKGLYSSCNIFVFPSKEEGDPIALKEALASGKPLVGTNISGISMQIRDGWNGYLVELGDAKKMADIIVHLADNENIMGAMGKNSRSLAVNEFDWEVIAGLYIKEYEAMTT